MKILPDIIFVCECSPQLRPGIEVCESMRMFATDIVGELPRECRVGTLNYSNKPEPTVWAENTNKFDSKLLFAGPCGMPNLYHALSDLSLSDFGKRRVILVIFTYCGAADLATSLDKNVEEFLHLRCTIAVVCNDVRLQCNRRALPIDNNAFFKARSVIENERLRAFILALLKEKRSADPGTPAYNPWPAQKEEKPEKKDNPGKDKTDKKGDKPSDNKEILNPLNDGDDPFA